MERNFMKCVCRFICPLLLLLSVEANSQAYTYISFPDSSFTWKGNATCVHGLGGSSYKIPWTFKLIGDTTVFGFTYHKLRKDSSISVSYIREDSTKKVYIHNSTTEMLLYDFGVEVGDTTTCAGGVFVVNSVDTLFYNGIKRRRLVMNYPANYQFGDVWIEGIGSTAGGPIGYAWHWLFCQAATSSSLCLAKKDSVILYGDYCPVPVGMETFKEQRITAFPNPTTTSFILQLSLPPTTQTYFQLCDALGRQVKHEEITSAITTIHRDNLPSGIYFWQLQAGNKILDRGKLVME